MGIVLAIIGGLIAVICFANGMAVPPESAIQQQVQELRIAQAFLGLIVLAAGVVVFKLEQIRKQLTKSSDAEALKSGLNKQLAGPDPSAAGTASSA